MDDIETITPQEIIRILDAASDLLTIGWCKYTTKREVTTATGDKVDEYCMLEAVWTANEEAAVWTANGDAPRREELFHNVVRELARFVPHTGTESDATNIIRFNDASGRKLSDVLEVFEKCRESLEISTSEVI